MSLLKKSLLKKMKERVAEEKLIGSHPLMRMSVERNVRDAYFQGLVFAAFADDNQVDEQEGAYLANAGKALALSDEDVAEAISFVGTCDDERKIALASDVAHTMKGQPCCELFLCEFSKVWVSHKGHDLEELQEFRKTLSEWMDFKYDARWFASFDEVVASVGKDVKCLLKLDKRLSQEGVEYLFPGASEKLTRALKEEAELERKKRARREKDNRKKSELVSVKMVKEPTLEYAGGMTWEKAIKKALMVIGIFNPFNPLFAARASFFTQKTSGTIPSRRKIIARDIPRRDAEKIKNVIEKFGGKVELIDCEVKDSGKASLEDECGQLWSVWCTKKPELAKLPGEILYACGGPKRFFGSNGGVLRSNISREEAEKIKTAFEKAGGEVEIRPS